MIVIAQRVTGMSTVSTLCFINSQPKGKDPGFSHYRVQFLALWRSALLLEKYQLIGHRFEIDEITSSLRNTI